MSRGTLASDTTRAVLLNTHHIYKVIALVIMTIDHVGAYLYPDDMWWRVVGRVAFPIFLFLVGHALSYGTRRDTYLWAALAIVISPFLGQSVFALNILVTILCCQLLLAQMEKRGWFRECPWTLLVGCIVFWVPTNLLMEYGSLCFLYALMGYAVRSGQIATRAGYAVSVLALTAFLGSTALGFEFSTIQMLFAIAGTTAVTMLLVNFTHRPVTLAWMPNMIQRAVLWLSRRSLQYYVVHRAILQTIGTVTGVLSPAFRWFS